MSITTFSITHNHDGVPFTHTFDPRSVNPVPMWVEQNATVDPTFRKTVTMTNRPSLSDTVTKSIGNLRVPIIRTVDSTEVISGYQRVKIEITSPAICTEEERLELLQLGGNILANPDSPLHKSHVADTEVGLS